MRLKILIFSVSLFIIFYAPVFAQNHTSVHLENQVYYILEQAQLKGLCAPMSGIKPYTRSVVTSAIIETLESEKLNKTETEILLRYLDQFSKPKSGLDWKRGAYHTATTIGKKEAPLTLNVGVNLDMEGSAAYHSSLDDIFWGTEIWLRGYFNGDVGNNVSWEFSAEGGLVKSPRQHLGWYNTYYEGFEDHGEYRNQLIKIYSEPLTYFPYTYNKRWDGSIHFLGNLSDFESWPETIAGAKNLISEVSASFFDNKLFMRLGRISREWGSVPDGSSLGLNQMARPFIAMEYEFQPVSWFKISSMTGFLEFFNTKGEKESGMTFQNAYSISMMQFKIKEYFFIDLGETVVYPKRFELGYISPITNTIFYKNNVGDFDNLGAILNIKAQYPGVGNVWFSLFWDEAFWVRDFYELDRTMISIQAGTSFPLPILSFTSMKISYTRINPYCYTHVKNFTPWYGDIPMEQAYVNNGVGIGYYLPPNSDEILVRFKTMPVKNIIAGLQYQLIRHGADFGSSAVDGSNLLSELDPNNRDGSNPILKRYFLRDGAYQWMHIIKLSGEWTLSKAPVTIFCEAGTVFSYFTNIEEEANVTGRPHPYSIIDTSEYPKSTNFIARLGVKVYPR